MFKTDSCRDHKLQSSSYSMIHLCARHCSWPKKYMPTFSPPSNPMIADKILTLHRGSWDSEKGSELLWVLHTATNRQSQHSHPGPSGPQTKISTKNGNFLVRIPETPSVRVGLIFWDIIFKMQSELMSQSGVSL